MANTTKIFIDTSGSTGGHYSYWSYVQSLVSKKEYDQAAFYAFDASARQVSRATLLALCRSLGEGDRGTWTSTIARLLKTDDAIVIVTDGQVEESEIKKCDALLAAMPLKSVEVHFEQTGGQMDLSVAAPFTRNTPSAKIVINREVMAQANTKEKIDLASYFGQPEKFLAELDALRARMALVTTGRRDDALRNELLDLQKNLIAHLASKGTNSFDALRSALSDNYELSLKLMEGIIARADSTLGKRVADGIQTLLRVADGSDYSFANIMPSRLTRASTVASAPVAELPYEEHHHHIEFSCPITLDDDIPLCFIARGMPILADVEKSKMEDLLTNPLLFLLDPVLVTRLIERIDHLIGFEATKELFARASTITSPLTRRSISSALTFGLGTEHIKATNVALADLFFGNKLVGQPELWLAVVYLVVSKEIPYLASEAGFLKAFQTHLTHRMRKAMTNLTLSGLPIEPLIKAPVDVAVWYCAVSPFLATTTSNRLRDFGATGKYLLELVELLGYRYEREQTLRWMSLYKAFAWMMNQEKERTNWRAKIRAQYQNALTTTDGSHIVFLDGPATDESRPRLMDFAVVPNGPKPSLWELIALAQDYVDARKKTNDVYIPNVLNVSGISTQYVWNYPGYPEGSLIALAQKYVDARKKTNDVYIPNVLNVSGISTQYVWNYPGYPEGSPPDTFVPTLSPTTFRPLTMDRATGQHWKECSTKRYGDLKKQISLYNYFIRFVHEHARYPASEEEYIVYVAQKQASREVDAIDTLPVHMRQFVFQLFANYERVLGKGFGAVPVAKFIEVTKASMREVDRKKMEEGSIVLDSV